MSVLKHVELTPEERAAYLKAAGKLRGADEEGMEYDDAAADINWLVDLVAGIRSVRSEMNVPAGAVAPQDHRGPVAGDVALDDETAGRGLVHDGQVPGGKVGGRRGRGDGRAALPTGRIDP